MEVDFPTSREEFRRETGYDFPFLTDDEMTPERTLEITQHVMRTPIDSSDCRSRNTDESGDGFLGWPSRRSSTGTSDCRSHRSINDGNNRNDGDGRSKSNDGSDIEVRHERRQERIPSDNGDGNTVGDVTVEFPSDRTPFRKSLTGDSSYKSVGSLSGYAGGGSKGPKGGLSGDSSENDSSATSTQLQRMNSSPSIRSNRRVSLGNSVGSNTTCSSQGGGGNVRRRSSKSIGSKRSGEQRRSLATINSDTSLHNSTRRRRSHSGDLRQSLKESLVRQSSGSSRELRGSLPRRKSKEGLKRRQSLTKLHDENAKALPLLGWDRDSDSSSLRSSSNKRGSLRESLTTSGRNSFGPASVNPRPKGMKSSTQSSGMGSSIASSLKASQQDHAEAGNALCEEFVPRGSYLKMMNDNQMGNRGEGAMTPSLSMGPNPFNNDLNNGGNGNSNRTDLPAMMMDEEVDSRKPWRRALPAGSVVVQQSRPSIDRRASGYTMRSSFTSDMSFGDFMRQEMMQAPSVSRTEGATLQKAMGVGLLEESADAKSEGLTAVAVVAGQQHQGEGRDETMSIGGSDTLGDNTLRSSKKLSTCGSMATSALSEDDDEGSELTELRQAQEALFPVPESVSVSSQNDAESVSSSNRAMEPLAASMRSGDGGSRSRDLSSLDIVQEERAQCHPHPIEHLPPVKENVRVSADREQMFDKVALARLELSSLNKLEDLPSSSASLRKSANRRSNKMDDDSVSYSDIDVEPGQPQPSIRMCMTVRNSVIEREFATDQLTDVEFGETKEPHDAEMTLEDLLEGPSCTPSAHNGNDHIGLDLSHHQISMRSCGNTSSSKKSSSKRTMSTISIKRGVMKRTAKLDTNATKNLRRKNKRLWKFCVWNCRKITVCLVLGLCILAGFAVLAWWGAVQVTARKKGNDGSGVAVAPPWADGAGVSVASDGGSTSAPASSDSKQWPPAIDSNRIPLEGGPTGYPSSSPPSSPSLRGTSNGEIPTMSVIELLPELAANATSLSNHYEEARPSASPSDTSLGIAEAPSSSSFPSGLALPTVDPNDMTPTSSSPTSQPTIVNITGGSSASPVTYSYTENDRLTAPSLSPSEIPSVYLASNTNESSTSIPSVHPSSAVSFQDPSLSLTAQSLSPNDITPAYLGSNTNESSTSIPSVNPSSVVSLQDPNVLSQAVISTHPSSGPSSWSNSTLIQEPAVANNASNVSSYPSSSPSSNASYIISPSTNSSNTNDASSYPSFSPSTHNSSFIQYQSANSSGVVTPLPPLSLQYYNSSSPSNNTSNYLVVEYQIPSLSSNESSLAEPQGVISSGASLITMNQVSSNYSDYSKPTSYESIQAIRGAKEFEYAGASVSMSPTGEFIAVGFKEADGPAIERTGLVRVYRSDGNNVYSPFGRDGMFGSASGDEFGTSVSISDDGKRVAVGARSSSMSPEKLKNGRASVFEYSAVNETWVQLGSTVQGVDEMDRLGFSVSMSGDGSRVAVGAPRANGGTGSATIYEYNGSDWIPFDNVIVSDDVGDRAGFSLSLSNDGNTLAVGAFTSSRNGLARSGSVTVYRLEGSVTENSSSLVNQGQPLVGAIAGAQMGYSVSLSDNGSRVVVGSTGFGTENTAKTGLCAVYELQEENWTQIATLIGNEDSEKTGLYVSITNSGNAISCSKIINVDGAMKGAVSVLEEHETGWDIVDTVISSLGSSASFGASVSISQDGSMLLSGDPSHNSSAGYFEFFTRF